MTSIQLRPITADDGPAVAALAAHNRSTSPAVVRTHTLPRPEFVPLTLQSGAVGVAAETPDYDGLIGMMWMATGECWYEGELLPYAHFYQKMVHPAYRRQGIGWQLTMWMRVQADARLGSGRVALASIAPNNEASMAASRKWLRQRVDGRVMTVLHGLRARPPRPLAGVNVRPADENELEEFAQRANECYRGCNLYPPASAQRLRDWQLRLALGRELAEVLVAVGANGRLSAGLVLFDVGSLAPLLVESAAWPIRVTAEFLGLLPEDGVVRPIRATSFWFAPGCEAAAAYLWESARWLWRERGSLIWLTRDTRSSVAQVVRPAVLRPSHLSALVLDGPVPMREDRPLYLQHV